MRRGVSAIMMCIPPTIVQTNTQKNSFGIDSIETELRLAQWTLISFETASGTDQFAGQHAKKKDEGLMIPLLE